MRKTDMKPKVTIVIPVYNGERYVKYAIDSAIAQTYKNLEILVVDDGSTDKTKEIVKSYGKKVRYIFKDNGGVSSALNLAIKEMKGEYFSWLSHDDTYEPNKIECEIDFLKEHNLLSKKVIVFSDYYLIDKNGKLITEAKKNHQETIERPEYNLLKGHINGLTLLIPKKAFEDYGDFDTELSCVQDYDMWWKMMKTYKFVHIPETLVSTRWHKKQTTHTNPRVVTEGNEFYLRLLSGVSEERMEEIEGSKYNFLMTLADFHKDGPYSVFAQKCKEQANKIFEKAGEDAKNKKVSVIIPFYNRIGETMRAARSVLRQTHENVELILVNDGSRDDISKLEEFAKNNGAVFLSTKTNNGASVARNLGIKAASGDYIAFLDSDDEFTENKLEIQLQYVVASKSVFSHTSYIRIDDEKNEEVIHSGLQSGRCSRELMCGCTIATPTVIIKRDWLLDEGLSFDADIEIGEDTCLWLEIMRRGIYLGGVDEPLSIIHVNKKSAAYNDVKQAQGLKSIIKYLINDEYYSKFDFELSCIMKAYAYCVEKSCPTEEPYAGDNILQKLVFFIRNEGFLSAGKRAAKKVKTIFSKSLN